MGRQIILDTETTGLEPQQGHRIIEVGCVEMVNRRLTGNNLHLYINPEREIDEGALEVHGISAEFLADKPVFAEIVDELVGYLSGAELIIHNAPFDVGFIDHEFGLVSEDLPKLAAICSITDTLVMARKMHPGQRNSLDALCRRYEVDNSRRELHGALLDSEILADVYLAMTGGQKTLSFGAETAEDQQTGAAQSVRRIKRGRRGLKVVTPSGAELEAHQAFLDMLGEKADDGCVWLRD